MGKKTSYRRVLLKISGEALMGLTSFGISNEILSYVANELVAVYNLNVEIALVVGGGNIFRGVKQAIQGMDRVQADYMGMMATVINSLALQDALEQRGVSTRLMTGLHMPQIAEPFVRRRAIYHLEKGRLIIFAAGTGNPYFTTDTAAALRAQEINAQVFLKATMVDGIYDSDPLINHQATKLERLTYDEMLSMHLKVIDATAITLARDNNLLVIIFNLMLPGNIIRVLKGEAVGSRVWRSIN